MSIQPSGRDLHFPFDATDTALEKEESLKPLSKEKEILLQRKRPSTEEVRQLLPVFDGSS